eukprot:m51a1_g13868 hypothetical protein (402) ;mRNA; f:616186-617798
MRGRGCVLAVWVLAAAAVAANPYYIHITDSHLDPLVRLRLRPYGHFKCDAPKRLLDEMVRDIAALYPDPELILLTGDSSLHNDQEATPAAVVGTWYDISSIVRTHFPKAAVYPTFGNHEAYPCNVVQPTPRHPIITEIAAVWKKFGFIPDEAATQTLEDWGYYTALHRPGHRIVSTNSHWYNTENSKIVDGQDETGQAKWFEAVLRNASLAHEIVWHVTHIPINTTSTWRVFSNDLIGRMPAGSVKSFYGHTHYDEVTFVRTSLGGPSRSIGYIAPGSSGYHGVWPSVRVTLVDPDTLHEVDMRTYHVDLAKSNRDNKLAMSLFYETRETFGMGDLTLESWDALLRRIRDDEATAIAYIRARDTDEFKVPGRCDLTCRVQLFCSIAYATPSLQAACLENPI